MRKQRLTTQETIKMFFGMILFMLILATLTSCSKSGKHKAQPKAESPTVTARLKDLNGYTFTATVPRGIYETGDKVVTIKLAYKPDRYSISETPAYYKDTTTTGLEYRVGIIQDSTPN